MSIPFSMSQFTLQGKPPRLRLLRGRTHNLRFLSGKMERRTASSVSDACGDTPRGTHARGRSARAAAADDRSAAASAALLTSSSR